MRISRLPFEEPPFLVGEREVMKADIFVFQYREEDIGWVRREQLIEAPRMLLRGFKKTSNAYVVTKRFLIPMPVTQHGQDPCDHPAQLWSERVNGWICVCCERGEYDARTREESLA